MTRIQTLLENNKRWSREITEQSPRFFPDLAAQQNPDILWIGCSDSRVAANMIVGLMPGEVFVHRNVANLVVHSDLNCLSVIQFAVEVLKVTHIIVCGHYGCGGVLAALDNERHGLIDNWLRHIQEIAKLHGRLLDAISDPKERSNRLCELNVSRQVINVAETTVVGDAWGRGEEVTIHGWLYGLKDGLIRDQGISISSEAELDKLRSEHFDDSRG